MRLRSFDVDTAASFRHLPVVSAICDVSSIFGAYNVGHLFHISNALVPRRNIPQRTTQRSGNVFFAPSPMYVRSYKRHFLSSCSPHARVSLTSGATQYAELLSPTIPCQVLCGDIILPREICINHPRLHSMISAIDSLLDVRSKMFETRHTQGEALFVNVCAWA